MGEFNTNVPIYIQIIDNIKNQIMNGTLKPNDKVPSVRELALELGVNPNTIQRAFAELEREGYIRTERAVGRYVNDNQSLIDLNKQQQIKDNVEGFIINMKQLGLTIQDIKEKINDYEEE
ncbi:MAG: GntR family transcriptional regulator [Coprobacillus sp.]